MLPKNSFGVLLYGFLVRDCIFGAKSDNAKSPVGAQRVKGRSPRENKTIGAALAIHSLRDHCDDCVETLSALIKAIISSPGSSIWLKYTYL